MAACWIARVPLRSIRHLLGPLGLLAATLLWAPAALAGTVIVDFESGSAPLTSYPGEDFDPDDWEIQSEDTFGGSAYALRLWGNTWKQMEIDPQPLTASSVWRVAIKSAERGELQAFAVRDSSDRELFYVVSGTQVVLSDKWNVVYQGAYPQEEWRAYLLPIGRDWLDTYGDLPRIARIVFVNDRDGTPDGRTLFDEVRDVTDELPVAPLVEARRTVADVIPLTASGAAGERLYRVEAQFEALVYDPDSQTHTYRWDFGDGTTSPLPAPGHSFTATADHTFTIALEVTDDTGLFGRDTCQVTVDPGAPPGFHSIDFAGDIFTGRNYQSQGGLIETHGIEFLFEHTRGILGDAADITMVNAECPFTDRGEPHPTKSVVFRTWPENIAGLVSAGVDIASLANNHIIDYGLEGLLQTHDVFDSVGIVRGGSGINDYFANQPCFYTQEGIRLGFVPMCNRTGRQYGEQPFFDAGCGKFGFGYWLQPNIERAVAQAESLADIVICYPHSGEEYVTAPPEEDGGTIAGGAEGSRELSFGAEGDPVEDCTFEAWGMQPDPWGVQPVITRDADLLDRAARAAAEGRVEPELCPPHVPADQARDVRFRIWPGMTDRELRRHAIDLGADAVINSHPHVLQGFEVYNGALIAHSLGNFVFDLYYPETMPTITLHALFDKEGIYRWSFKPAFIDHYVPVPAHGRLAREILDRMADYSRQLGAVVGIDYDYETGIIFLDPAQATEIVTAGQGAADFVESDGKWVTRPIELAGNGSLSRVLDLLGVDPQDCEIAWGREVLWFGRFEMEEEGHHMWNLNSGGEWIDDQTWQEGGHALCLHRDHTAEEVVTTLLEKHLPAVTEGRYSVCGWMKTDNANGAKFSVRFYRQRYTWTAEATEDMGPPVDGTSDWTWYASDFSAPENCPYFNLRAALSPPSEGEAHAWFDDLRVVEWLDWQPASLPLEVPYPNNLRFLQVRVPYSAAQATVLYEETRLSEGGFAAVESAEHRRSTRAFFAGAGPNPFQRSTALRYRLDQSAQVSLAIYDLTGRLVERLADEEWKQPGWHTVAWSAPRATTGVYFARLTVEGREQSCKLMMVR